MNLLAQVDALKPQSWQQAISALLNEHGIVAVLLLVVVGQFLVILQLIKKSRRD